jgi:MFS transporter, FSR family, fosmidomycin resistance protein
MDRRASVVISGMHFFVDIYSGFFPVYLVIAGLDPVTSALIASSSSFIANALQPLLGLWADRSRGKPSVFLGILGGALCMSAIGLTQNFALLFVLVLVGKLGVSLFHPAAASIASESGGSRRELGFSVFTAIGTVGYSLSQPVFSACTSVAGLRGSVYLAIPGVLIAFAYLLFLPVQSQGTGSRLAGADMTAALRRHTRQLGILFVVMVVRQAFIMTVTFFVAKLYEEWGAGRAAYATASTIFIFAGAMSVLLMGLLRREMEPRRVLLFSCLSPLPFYAAFLAFGASGNLALAGLFLGLTGFLSNTGHVANVVTGQRLVPELSSLVSGILMGFAWAVANFGQPFAAALSGRLGFPGMLSGFVGLGALLIVAAGLSLAVPAGAAAKSASALRDPSD